MQPLIELEPRPLSPENIMHVHNFIIWLPTTKEVLAVLCEGIQWKSNKMSCFILKKLDRLLEREIEGFVTLQPRGLPRRACAARVDLLGLCVFASV